MDLPRLLEAEPRPVLAFQIFAPDLVNPNAIRWASVIVFGGAGVAAIAGLVMMYTHRERGA